MQRDFEIPPLPPARTAPAWVLPCAPATSAAIGLGSALEVLGALRIVAVPCARPGALGLVAWQGQWIPLVHVAARAEGQAALPPALALVVAWQVAGGEPQVGALALHAPPLRATASDAAACAVPPAWQAFAPSCFLHEGAPVPVLDLARVFG